MRALLICVGSRGDAEPFVSLADRLLEDGNSVDLFLQPELRHLVPTHYQEGLLTVHDLSFTQYDMFKYAGNPSRGTDHENPRVRFLGIVTDIIAELVLPCWKSVLEAAKNCDIMVTSALARALCFALSSKLDKPTVLIHLQPLVPTMLFPHYSNHDDFVQTLLQLTNENPEKEAQESKGAENLESWWLLEKYQHEFLEESLDKMYNEMELSPRMDFETTKKILSGNESRVIIANAFDDNLIPRITDGGPQVHHVDALADHYIPKTFEPPQSLVEFLSKNPKPICIGFGSMPYEQVTLVLDVLQTLDCKAVLVGKGLLELPSEYAEWAKTSIIQVSNVPYAYLLPQCKLMVCHGGAGTVHVTLRAGIPIVISPFMGDQFFFADLCKAKGLGARAGKHLSSATKDDFVKAIQEAMMCTKAANEFGEAIRAKELGVDKLKALVISQTK